MEAYHDEEREIDLSALFKTLWRRKKPILIILGIFTALGLIAALATEHRYVTRIAFVPQSNSSVSSRLSSLASLAGVSLDDGAADGPISPVVYPKVINNLDYLKGLAYTPIHFKGYDEPIPLIDWFNDEQYQKKSFFKGLIRYTVGLPGVIKDAIEARNEDETLTFADSTGLHAPTLTAEESTAIKAIRSNLDLNVVKSEKHVVLSATMNESNASAELAIAAYDLFKKYISEFKIKKAKDNLDYLEKQYAAAKADYEKKQASLAWLKDRHQGKRTAAAEVEFQRLSTETELARMLYLELAKNCLSARVKVTEDNVAFTELTPAYVPRKSANSRKTVLLIWMVAGLIVGCGYALLKDAREERKKTER
ncbi:MAG: hypothetical protein IJ654_06265 [Bacteroidales bacterium]|nr:hypothetical protein [Bacteroidales bacterium]